MKKTKLIKFLIIISIINTVLFALLTNFADIISFLLTMDIARAILNGSNVEEKIDRTE